jgi:hypothetical protein
MVSYFVAEDNAGTLALRRQGTCPHGIPGSRGSLLHLVRTMMQQLDRKQGGMGRSSQRRNSCALIPNVVQGFSLKARTELGRYYSEDKRGNLILGSSSLETLTLYRD